MQTSAVHAEGQPVAMAHKADLNQCKKMTEEEFLAALEQIRGEEGPPTDKTPDGTTYTSYGFIVPMKEYGYPMMLMAIEDAIAASGFGDKAVIVWRSHPGMEVYRDEAHRAGVKHIMRARFSVEKRDA